MERANYFWYIDDNHEIHNVPTFEEWCQKNDWDNPNRVVATSGNDDIWISTVFIGLNYRWFTEGPPFVFESMVFGGEHDGIQMRYSTYDEALAGHKKLVELAFSHVTGVS